MILYKLTMVFTLYYKGHCISNIFVFIFVDLFLSTTRTCSIKHICIKTIVNTSNINRLVCVFSTDKHCKEQLNCYAFDKADYIVFKYVHVISLVYIILVNSTKTLTTHDFAFLAHISTNLVSHLIRFSYKLPNPTRKAPATGFVLLVPESQCFPLAARMKNRPMRF